MSTLTYSEEMVAVHRPLRREFGQLPDIVGAVRDGDRQRAEQVGGWVATMTKFLRHHHEAEDTLWPLLRERAADDAAAIELVDQLELQHEQLAARIAEVSAACDAWQTSASADDRDHLAEAIALVRSEMEDHLVLEETQGTALAQQHVSSETWNEMGERGRAVLKGMEGLLVMGAVMEEMNDAERAWLLGGMPPPVRWFVVPFAQFRYRRYIAGVRAD